jgi:hypothetical protein
MEGRPGAAAGWTGLAIAGAVPFFGDALQGLVKSGRAISRINQSVPVGPLPNRARQVVENQSDVLDKIRKEQISKMTVLDDVDIQALSRASPSIKNMNTDNIWVIHETRYAPTRFNEDVVLRPTRDFSPETGRDTIHFSLNHTAAGHELRAAGSAPYVVVARLSDVLKANPNALDNLAAIDTFFTPPPGQGLRLPNAIVLQNSQNARTQVAIREIVESSGGSIISGGKRESFTLGADARIRQLARELEVPSMLHDGHPSFTLEMSHISRSGMGNSDPMYYLPLLSRNGRFRAAQDNIWTQPPRQEQRFRVFGDEGV